jgi:hypothetical protein
MVMEKAQRDVKLQEEEELKRNTGQPRVVKLTRPAPASILYGEDQ